jgi:hypothetical protein
VFRSSPRGYTPNRARHDDVNTERGGGKWFRQPVVWLGALIFVASLIGCIVTIVLAARDADAPVATTGATVMKVPSSR